MLLNIASSVFTRGAPSSATVELFFNVSFGNLFWDACPGLSPTKNCSVMCLNPDQNTINPFNAELLGTLAFPALNSRRGRGGGENKSE